MRLRWLLSSGCCPPTPGEPGCSTSNSSTPRCPARRRRLTPTSARPRSAATTPWCILARGDSTSRPPPPSRLPPGARGSWPGGSAVSACRTCAPCPTRPPPTTRTPCTWRSRRAPPDSCWPTAPPWASRMRARMRSCGQTQRCCPADPCPAATACSWPRRKHQAKRALPDSCAAGSGGKWIHPRRGRAEGHPGAFTPRCCCSSRRDPTVCAPRPPSPGEGAPPWMTLCKTFSLSSLHLWLHWGGGSVTPLLQDPLPSWTLLLWVGAGASPGGSRPPSPFLPPHEHYRLCREGDPTFSCCHHALHPTSPLPWLGCPLSQQKPKTQPLAGDPQKLQADTPHTPVPDCALPGTTQLLTFSPLPDAVRRGRGEFCMWRNKCYFRLSEAVVTRALTLSPAPQLGTCGEGAVGLWEGNRAGLEVQEGGAGVHLNPSLL